MAIKYTKPKTQLKKNDNEQLQTKLYKLLSNLNMHDNLAELLEVEVGMKVITGLMIK